MKGCNTKVYNDFAYIYDKLMYDVDYKGYANHIEEIVGKSFDNKKLIADLGCGTGSLCIELSKRGYDMIGIDLSADMLSCAKEKAFKEKQEILFLQQDMSEFELYGTVDACISMLDSINYLRTKEELQSMFKLVKNYLNPDGVFIFDINSPYKLSKVLGNNVFYEIGDDITYIWQNSYDSKSKICYFDLTFFVRDGSSFVKYDEQQEERVWSLSEIKKAIHMSGLTLEKVYSKFDFSPVEACSERIFCLCKKSNI